MSDPGLADLIAAHQAGDRWTDFTYPSIFSDEPFVATTVTKMVNCSCGESMPADSHSAHVAAMIAETHAVFELPKPWMEGGDAEWTDGIITAHIGSGKVRCYLEDGRMTSDDAREIGAGLIAAAAAADVSEVSS